MEVKVINEYGYEEALLGISLSFNSKLDRMPARAEVLSQLDGGHNKFLESMCVWLDVNAPRYWWSQFDTYRIGVTKQSESTMHTLTKHPLTQDNFEDIIDPYFIDKINEFIENGDLEKAKSHLPEAFLQRRIICTNYKALRGIANQRFDHKLSQWLYFIQRVSDQLSYPQFIYSRRSGRNEGE